jgi:RsiW-degrading membrane proteinase PrsW (M82 family)
LISPADVQQTAPAGLVEALGSSSTPPPKTISLHDIKKELPGAYIWLLGLLVLLVLFVVFVLEIGAASKVPVSRDSVGDSGISMGSADHQVALSAARGRPCWLFVLVFCTLLLTVATFLLTFVKALSFNMQLQRHPQMQRVDWRTGTPADLTQLPIRSPGERAFEAGAGVALSVSCACILLLVWRQADVVQIRPSLLGLFGIRGATLAVLIAGVLEVGMLKILKPAHPLLGRGRGSPPVQAGVEGLELANLALLLAVGVFEEVAKAFALLVGATFAASAIRAESAHHRADDSCSDCCSRLWRVLLESPRVMMLGGLACGFGFMTFENSLYLIEVASMPPMDWADAAKGHEEEEYTMMRVARLATTSVRVLLNLHPWLSGLTAARLARVVFVESESRTITSSKGLTLVHLASALAPVIALHVFYDILVLMAPGWIALLAPLVFCAALRAAFTQEWQSQPVGTQPASSQAPSHGANVPSGTSVLTAPGVDAN